MDPLIVKFSTYAKSLPPQPVRLSNPPWDETSEKKSDDPRAWPWVPFVEASKFGLELIYPYDTECHVVAANGTIRFDWDFAREPGVTGGEFRAFSPEEASQYYLINTRVDIAPPPGYVLRTEPHPRYFTDDSGTVPLSMIGHLQNEWYPRLLFIVFRTPPPGKRHVFRKGEPFAQILFLPQHMKQEKIRSAHEDAGRKGAGKALPHQPIRMTNPTWAGALDKKMEDGSEPQPWHCLPFIEASTYGQELLYPYETECQVVNADGKLRFEGAFPKEAGDVFASLEDAHYYRLNAKIDLMPPAGVVPRIEPHPRYFTDDTRTAPLPLIGHLPGDGGSGVVFRAPRPGERHIFRKGDPIAQIIFIPEPLKIEAVRMGFEEAASRHELDTAIEVARMDIAEHVWRNPGGNAFNNHYKVLARAFARDGLAGIKEVVRKATESWELPKNLTIPECMAAGLQRLREQKFEQAERIFTDILSRDPNNARTYSALGICYDSLYDKANALRCMTQAVALQPSSANYHANLGELLRRQGRLKEAEASLRSAVFINSNDAEFHYALGLTLEQQGRTADALQSYRAAVATGTPAPQAHHAMGMILAKQGKHAEARASFEAVLAVAPNYAPARQALQDLPKN